MHFVEIYGMIIRKKRGGEGQRMNKSELVAAMAEKASLSKKDAEAALNAFTDTVAAALKRAIRLP